MKALRLLAILTIVAACGFAQTAAPSSAGADSRIANEVFKFFTKTLADEARQARIHNHFPRSTANFADGTQGEVDLALFSQKILAPLDKDPLIDAYIRWQLTSFKPSLDSVPMNDRRFARLLDDLPELVPNPRADASLVEAFRKAQQTESLNAQQIETLNGQLNELAKGESDAKALNIAALGFRQWLGTQLPKHGERALLWRIEHLRAQISAGWPCDEQKQALEAELEKAKPKSDFDEKARQRVAETLALLEGKQARYLVSAVVRDDQFSVEFGLTNVQDFEVRRWLKMLERQ